ncbi:hypothetical protein BGW38_000867 [Lunasporangiospora selenospora]|uniref:N6-adenosine-specific RNA methylase IME4 n=1 Tax=Lunasporangiospora selenospora TaxID=979761 RepID=A0A9P6FUW2_9FUNG|nr:hypothetical protein BGW38_000867 [Lunasporangiospora selenospora]
MLAGNPIVDSKKDPAPAFAADAEADATSHSPISERRLSGPLQTLNSSLKRIRLSETAQPNASELAGEPMARSDSMEQEWGNLDPADLDESELTAELDLPTTKKPRKENDEASEDLEDLDDFMPSGATTTSDEKTQLPQPSLTNSLRSPQSILDRPLTSVPFKSKVLKTKSAKSTMRSVNGMEDVFTHEQVKNWSEVRLKTWDHRRTNVEAFYYRFVDPTEGQQNGPWSKKSTEEFMARLQEWKDRGIRIGTSWGVFSMGVSHKAGYQCSSYYRKLLENKTLIDPAYAWEKGKLIMVNKSSGGEMAVSGLSERWDTEEVKEIEANIKQWIKDYHSNPGSRPLAVKTKRVDVVASSSTGSKSGNSAKLNLVTTLKSSASVFRPSIEAPRVKATTIPAFSSSISIRSARQIAEEADMIPVVDIDNKLAEYASFMKKTSDTKKFREPLSLTVPGTISSSSSSARKIVPVEVRKTPMTNSSAFKGQAGLSLFWKNIRPVRVECPEVVKDMIPKDVEQRPTWAHRVITRNNLNTDGSVEGCIYKETESLLEFDWESLSEGFSEPVADFQGILADPPWNFIVEDGRNDGSCRLTTKEFAEVIEKALGLFSNGIVSIWTHKAILPEVVSIMHGLGCRYVENLVWYKRALNNSDNVRLSPFFRTSKEILLMFKKGDGFDIRHQRTADVIIDFEKPVDSWLEDNYTEPKPIAAYEMMETLLPDARYIPGNGRGRLLELWAKKHRKTGGERIEGGERLRPGWFGIHELKRSKEAQAKASVVDKANSSTEKSFGVADSMETGHERADRHEEPHYERLANDMEVDMLDE